MSSITREKRTITLDGQTIHYILQRSSRRKRTIQLQSDSRGQLTLLAPRMISNRDIETFFNSHSKWVFNTLSKPLFETDEEAWISRGEVAYRGKKLQIKVQQADLGGRLGETAPTVRRTLEGNEIVVVIPSNLNEDEKANATVSAIKVWLWNEAEIYLVDRIGVWINLTGWQPSRVRISRARRRWGSCSGKGSINLSWRLITLPDDLSDYVIVHELAHLRELNHSSRFWNLVGSILPEYKEIRARLRAYRPSIAV